MTVMQNFTLEISEDELREVTQAYQILQRFLAKMISPNELYHAEFLKGLEEAQAEVADNELIEVNDFAGFVS